MGRGLIEPLDDVDQPAWNADLLDWMAADLAANEHDLKHTLASSAPAAPTNCLRVRPAKARLFSKAPYPSAYRPSNSSMPSPPSAASGKTAAPSSVWTAANRAAKSARSTRCLERTPQPKPNPPKADKPPAPVWIWDQKTPRHPRHWKPFICEKRSP